MIKNHFIQALVLITVLTQPCFAETIEFRADTMKGSSTAKDSSTTLLGNAYIKTSEMEISADLIEMTGKEYRIIRASGNVQGINSKSKFTFSSQLLEYDRKTKIAIIEKDVSLIDKENDVVATAQYIEYNQQIETAIMQISVHIERKDAICDSAFATYRKDAKLLELSGNPKITQNDDSYKAQEITMNLDTKEITLDGKVSGKVISKEENSEEKKDE